jgi:hypothetical protein
MLCAPQTEKFIIFFNSFANTNANKKCLFAIGTNTVFNIFAVSKSDMNWLPIKPTLGNAVAINSKRRQ